VAGTYASRFAAVAATGIGEEIIDDALAARLESRVRDGAPLAVASDRCFREAVRRKRAYGWLGVDRRAWCVAHTTRAMPYVVIGRQGRRVVAVHSALEAI
jgi:L-asparaginase